MGSVLSYFSSPSPLPLPSPSPLPLPSPSPSHPKIKYDVFLSFRGEDTRNNFTSHLYKAFHDTGIDAFIDYQLRSGDEISPFLLQAIEQSQISIVIFSKSYANSRWCLEELVKILECKKIHGQIVIPVFYEINPSDVRKQTGSFAVAFAQHQKRFKEDLDKVQKWRRALKEAADVSGFDSHVVMPESVLVEKIVENVLERLNKLNNMPSSDNKQLIGIESKITEIEVMLRMGDQMNNDIRKVGICGIGGIGKTTLAKAVFDKIYCQFESYYFSGSVREASEKKELNHMKQELYSAILKGENAYIYTFTERRLSRKKLLIVFDDVTSFGQIEYLFRDLDCFGSGSRIIITSRNHQVLKNCEVNDIYKVEELCFNDSLKLFCWHAFKQNRPNVDYKELSKGVVIKVGGVPLALKVLGSSLLGKRKEVWKSSMKRSENILAKNVHEVLKISYDGLDPDQQRIFLDIACFYKGWDVNLVKAIMEASLEIFIVDGLSVLEDTCLISILDNKLMMHDLLQAMGKTIVQQESVDPGKRTRLCNHNDIYDVLTNAMGTKKVEGISLDMSNIGDIHLQSDALVNMRNLRFLQFYTSNCLDNNNKVHVPQDLKFPLTKLRYFKWQKCPLQLLPSNSHFENLVILQLRGSNVEQLWSDVQQFNHLKEIDLEGSKNLIRFPDLKAPKLESLNLNECESLIEIPSSFQHLSRLIKLSFSNCKYLTSVPQLPKSLKLLSLSGCSKLQRLPELPNNLEDLFLLECSSLIEIPSSIQHLTKLYYLLLSGCKSLTSIPDCTSLISLQVLFLHNCSKLERLPQIPNNFNQIDLEGCTSLFEIPSSFKHLNKLTTLTFKGCESLTSIPDLMGLKSLTHLTIEPSSKLKELPKFPNSIQVLRFKKISIEELPLSLLHNLTKLSLIECGITEIPNSVCCLTSLEILELEGNNFERIPESIINLSNLWSLNIRHCERLRVLPKLPWADVDARNCKSLQEFSCPSLPNDFFAFDGIQYVQFISCFKLDQNSLNSFVKDTQREIQAQSPSYRQVYEGKNPPLNLCYPSNEIPEWFDFQSNGSLIDVKLPLDWINYNFLCFALCAVVSFPNQFELQNNSLDSNSVIVTYKCYVKSKEWGHDWDRMRGLLGGFYNSDYSMRSSHVIIGFGFHFFRELHDNEFTFEFYSSCKMEKCGVHLIFGKQLEKSDQNEDVDELHSEESKEDDELHLEEFNEKDEPHPKRLKHI